MASIKQALRVCALGILLTLAGSGPAFAGPLRFSNSSLVGSYIVEFFGHSRDGEGDGIGIFSFDGKGNLSGTDGSNCQLSGVYTIGSDGTGTMSITTDPNVFNTPGCFFRIRPAWNLVIADRTGSKVYASGSRDATDTQSATFTRRWIIQRHHFAAADLSGSYAFLIRTRYPIPQFGSSDPDATEAGRVAGVGILHSDGIGNISATIIILQTFKPGPQYSACSGTTNGSYTVNPDGTGTLSLTPIWVSPNCVSEPPSPSVNLILTPWNLFFDDATGNRLDLFTANSVELVEGNLSRQ
jgi:hypothetical protein